MINARTGLTSSTAMAAVFGVLVVLPAQAQEVANPPSVTSSVTPAPVEARADEGLVGDIVVTARRRSERLVHVPTAVTAQTGEQLANAGVTSTRDLSVAVPGLSFAMQGAWAQPSLRGITSTSTSAGAENPVAMYVDGIYQPSMLGSFFDLPDVERIEVLKGPQGTLFGRNATGGAIQIVTQQPKFNFGGKLEASAGLYTGGTAKDSLNYQAKGYITGPLGPSVAASLTFLADHTDGYLTNDVTGKRDGRINSVATRGKLLVNATDNLELQLSGYYMRRSDVANTAPFPLDGNAAPQFRPGLTGVIIADQPWHTAHDTDPKIFMRAYGGDFRATLDTSIGTLTSLTGYSNNKNQVRVDTDSAYVPAGAGLTSCRTAFVCVDYIVRNPAEAWSQELNYASRDFGDLSFVAGLFGYWADQGSYNDINFGALVRNNTLKTSAYAAYAEATYQFTDRFAAVFGGRYSYERRKLRGVSGANAYPGLVPQTHFGTWSWEAFSPRVALRYALNDATNLYGSFSRGFKSGQPNNLNGQLPADPEYLSAYEVGIKTSTGRYSFDASVFYYDYTDLQVQSFTGTSTLTTNAANAEIYGIDVDARVRATDDLQLRLATSYIPTAKYKDYTTASYSGFPRAASGTMTTIAPADVGGERMIRTPKLTITGQLDYDRDIGPGTIRANVTTYYSSTYFWELAYRVATRSYLTLNTRLAYEPAGTNLEIALYTKNLTNKAYVQGVVASNQSDMIVFAPPRQIGLSLRLGL